MKQLFRFIFLVFLGLTLYQNTFAQKVISGKVLDEIDSLPVNNAMVIVGKDTVRTDSLGSFVIINKRKSKKLYIITDSYSPQTVRLSGENEYSLSIYLNSDDNLFVKDRRRDSREVVDVNQISKQSNDTSHFSGIQGRFNAFIFDGLSKEPLEGTMVYMKETEMGGLTDSTGFISLLFDGDSQNITIDGLGYLKIDSLIKSNRNDEVAKIYLTPQDNELGGVTVYARKRRYRNKDNPAVTLIRKVIDHRDQNRMINNEDAAFKVYDKMVFYASNLPKFIYNNPILKRFRFLFENIDTSLLARRKLLPMYLSETIADNYYRESDGKFGKQMIAEKRLRFSEQFIESNNVSKFLDRLYDQVNIYDNQIRLLNNYFLSPIAPSAPSFYKFFIVDTTEINGEKLVQLRFEPRNTNDFLFEGRMFVTLNPDYAVTKVFLKLPKNTPVNLTNGLSIDLGFQKQANGKYWQNKSYYFVNFGFYNSKRGAVGVRYTVKSDYKANPQLNDSFFSTQQVALEHQGDTLFQKPNEYWQENRPEALDYFEARAYSNLDSAKSMKSYKTFIKTGSVLLSGFYPYHNVEFGRIYDIINFNPLEGFKPRVGGQTRIKNLQKLLIQAYLAYGFKDQRFKYYVGGTFALNNKYIYGFPMHNFKVSYQYDTRQPGQEMGFPSMDRYLDLIRRGDVNRYFYNRMAEIEYNKEFENHMLFTLGYNNLQQEAAGSLYYERADGTNDTIKNLTSNEFSLNWRYSPKELFFQNKGYRGYTDNGAWRINVKLTAGFNKGYSSKLLAYQKLETRIDKRFFIAPYGNVKMIIRAGYLNGSVPYPYLFLPLTNQTYRFSVESYNLMNYSEFAYDKYASITFDYHMKGFLLNRIPLLRQLYLREVFGFKVLYGGIRNQNLPQFNSSLLEFPKDANGRSIVNQFGNQPYVEASVGVENVVKIMRIDFVKRFTYTNLPLVAPWGIRFSFGVDF